MPKASGQSMRTIRTTPKPQPSRPIKHGFGTPPGPKTEPNAMGASKWADHLKPSSQKGSPAGGGKMPGQQVY
jgi:hypothetical protein